MGEPELPSLNISREAAFASGGNWTKPAGFWDTPHKSVAIPDLWGRGGGSNMGKLTGKVAIITGAGSGMGRASAVLFAKEGAKVAAGDAQAPLNLRGINTTYAYSTGMSMAMDFQNQHTTWNNDTVVQIDNDIPGEDRDPINATPAGLARIMK